jgi:[acyl-carrier-protein] S-malonyltransferase
MAAILGDTQRPIEDICAEATSEAGLVVPANYNSPGQVVISGEAAGVERAMALCKEAGAKRAIRLNVSGAFHSPLMETAAAGLAEALATAGFDDPHFAVYANVNAEPVTRASRAKELLIEQLSRPVRWTDEMRAIVDRYPGALYVEMGPGNVLVGLMKKIAPSVETATCGTAADIEALLARVAQQTQHPPAPHGTKATHGVQRVP